MPLPPLPLDVHSKQHRRIYLFMPLYHSKRRMRKVFYQWTFLSFWFIWRTEGSLAVAKKSAHILCHVLHVIKAIQIIFLHCKPIPVMKTGFSLWEKLHRENPVLALYGIAVHWNLCLTCEGEASLKSEIHFFTLYNHSVMVSRGAKM